ncbi:MAG: Flagellar hook-length control protein FliK, partial [Candidatus Taylorbacteria bacterium]|nr:Flagellar hook-length control protein FliK [Candidatus Taylorbacteria bacterium]
MKTHISILIALITLVSLGLMPASASAQLQASKCPAGLICVPATKTSPAYVPRTTPIACYSISGNLAVGSRGADVAALQAFLIEKRFDIPSISQGAVAKGHFGPSTQAALAKYQKSQNLQPTGTLNTASRTKINADSCSSAAVPVSRTSPLQLPISNNSHQANEFPRIAVPPQASVPTV